ncbi:hypothetical protein Misp02_09500 [Microtetraspora sp. NBRC 16547]|nr:hypothetical protein Misp02_09500 [Microtetraspora sp. NBRC 16547]
MHVVHDGPRQAPPLLLIHGSGASGGFWGPVVPALAGHHHVIRVDLPGCGQSPPAPSYDVPAQAGQVAALLDDLGLRHVAAAGHSSGGYVATALAEQRPDLVGSLALISSGPSLDALLRQPFTLRVLLAPPLGPLLWSRRSDAMIRKGIRATVVRPATLARNRTRVVPTLTVYQVLDRPDEVLDDGRLKYVPAAVAEGWRWALANIIKAGRTPEVTAQRYALFERRKAFVNELEEAGVPVVAGTDGGDVPFVVPGFSLHDELVNLVRSGLSPLRALRAATLEPARLLGLDDSIGTVAPGKAADLVVLDADPLADIRNTTRIHTVVTRGRVISMEQRARMLAEIESAAAA